MNARETMVEVSIFAGTVLGLFGFLTQVLFIWN